MFHVSLYDIYCIHKHGYIMWIGHVDFFFFCLIEQHIIIGFINGRKQDLKLPSRLYYQGFYKMYVQRRKVLSLWCSNWLLVYRVCQQWINGWQYIYNLSVVCVPEYLKAAKRYTYWEVDSDIKSAHVFKRLYFCVLKPANKNNLPKRDWHKKVKFQTWPSAIRSVIHFLI